MATIVQHKMSKERFALLGAAHHTPWETEKNLFGQPTEFWEPQAGQPLIAVCDKDGAIRYLHASKLVVICIDGRSVDALFQAQSAYR